MSTPVRHEHAGHPHEHDAHEHGERDALDHGAHEHGGHEHDGHEHEARDHVAHTHAGHEHGEHEREPGAAEVTPVSNDNLILDIGADTGALIIHAAAYRDQAEVEISAAGRLSARAHNIVRHRETAGGGTYAAVFPALAAGDYVVWQDADTQAGTVTIHGGTVASFRLDL